MLRTISDVLTNLPKDDGRRHWWEYMRKLINEKSFSSVFSRLLDHKDDCDYEHQVRIICGEIAKSLEGGLPEYKMTPSAICPVCKHYNAILAEYRIEYNGTIGVCRDCGLKVKLV